MARRFQRVECELLEAMCLPSSARGGRPDVLVRLQLTPAAATTAASDSGTSSTAVFRSKISPATHSPVLAERFATDLDYLGPMCASIHIYDREEAPAFLIATTDLEIGGPNRRVGSKWLLLTPGPTAKTAASMTSQDASENAGKPRLRVLWHSEEIIRDAVGIGGTVSSSSGTSGQEDSVTSAMSLSDALRVTGERMSEEEKLRITKEVLRTQPPDTTLTTTGATRAAGQTTPLAGHSDSGDVGYAALRPAAISDVLNRLSTLEEAMSTLTITMGSTLTRLESRIVDIESHVMQQRSSYPGGGGVSGAGGSHMGGGGVANGVRTAAARTVLVPPSTGLSATAMAGDAAKRPSSEPSAGGASFPLAKRPTGTSALDYIVAKPTSLSAVDEQVLAGCGWGIKLNLPTVPHGRSSAKAPVAGDVFAAASSSLDDLGALSPMAKHTAAATALSGEARRAVDAPLNMPLDFRK